MKTVFEPSITKPGPCGGTGNGIPQVWISGTAPAAEIDPLTNPDIDEDIEAAVLALIASSAAFAAGAPGVPAAASVAASAAWIAASAVALAA